MKNKAPFPHALKAGLQGLPQKWFFLIAEYHMKDGLVCVHVIVSVRKYNLILKHFPRTLL